MLEAVFYPLLLLLKLVGGVGFFLFSVIYNLLVIPFPYDVFVIGAAPMYGMPTLVVWFVAVIATTLAGVLCYAGGQRWLKGRVEPWFEGRYRKPRLLRRLRRRGALAVFATAVLPFPFSALCWAAGGLSLQRVPFVLALLASRMVRYGVLLAVAGQF